MLERETLDEEEILEPTGLAPAPRSENTKIAKLGLSQKRQL